MHHLLTALSSRPDPVITHYDVATAERTECSGVTFANWVAKTANFLELECDAELGTRLRLGIPTHWLRFIWIAGAWTVGATLADDQADIGLSGPELTADEQIKLASALAPFGMRFPVEPAGFIDTAVDVLAQPDVLLVEPVTDEFTAVAAGGETLSSADLVNTPAVNERLIITEGSVARDSLLLAGVCAGNGSLVIVRHGDAADITRIAEQERAVRHESIA